jgi:hypothetical protein
MFLEKSGQVLSRVLGEVRQMVQESTEINPNNSIDYSARNSNDIHCHGVLNKSIDNLERISTKSLSPQHSNVNVEQRETKKIDSQKLHGLGVHVN